MPAPQSKWKTVAFQGEEGAYGHIVAKTLGAPVGFPTFEAAMHAVASGKADGAAIPIENSSMGRIADIHHLLPESDLFIVGEHYLAIRHHLLAPKTATLKTVREAHSQLPALAQCAQTLKAMRLKPVQAPDTAAAARAVAGGNDPAKAAVASALAAQVYGLKILKADMNDHAHNRTRFILLGRKPWTPPPSAPCKTSLVFRTRSIPAALYKALGGFATNGVNLAKLESYILGGRFQAAQFYVEAEAHAGSPAMRNALEELAFYSSDIKMLGCYPKAA